MSSSRRRIRGAVSVLVVALFALALAACGDDSEPNAAESTDAPQTTEAEAQPTKGGTLTFVHQVDPRSLDPITMSSTTQASGLALWFNVYGALAIFTPEGDVEPYLAEDISSADGTTWTITLRPNLKFSDGTAFDAAAIKFNWDRLKDPASAAPHAANLATVASYEVVDAQTLRFTLKAPNNSFSNVIAGSALAYIGSPAAIQQSGQDFGNKPIGAGPFLLTEWVRNDHSTFDRNPSFFDAANVNLDRVIVRPVPDDTQKQNALSTGVANLIWTGDPRVADTLGKSGNTVEEFNWVAGIGVMFNMKRAPFNNKSVRVGIVQAMDRNALYQAYNGAPLDLGDGFLAESSPYFEPDAKYPQPDLAAAQKAIDTYVAANGELNLKMLYTSDSPRVQNLVTVLKGQLERVKGVSVELVAIDQAALVAGWRGGDWDIGFTGAAGLAFDPSVYNLLHSAGSFNFAGYANPQVDAALDRARKATDAAEVKAAYSEVQMGVTSDAYLAPYTFSTYALVAAEDVHLEAFGDGTPRVDKIWIEQ